MSRPYQICTRCVMDTSDPDIRFDEQGVCHHCHLQAAMLAQYPKGEAAQRFLEELVERIKAYGRDRDYDCLIGVSGGVDSTYVACKVKELGLRALAVHFDSGWNSETAIHNIERVVKTLGFDLYTFVVDWEEMRDLQLAFLRSGVANCDIPTDHGFTAILYRVALEKRFRYIITGANNATESHLPAAWGYTSRDLRHLRGIHKRFGSGRLKQYPQLSLLTDLYARTVRRVRRIDILNYLPYNKAQAMAEIERTLGWKYYGGKHYESVFTRFFQAYYLPKRFGFDKRRAHLSSLIGSGQMTREEALKELEGETYPADQLEQEKIYIAKKLRISVSELDAIVQSPGRSYRDFPSNERILKLLLGMKRRLRIA